MSAHPLNVLIIEDDVETAEHVAEGLRDQGHQVVIAAEGEEGFAQARTGNFAVLIVDRMLPGQDGLDIVVKLRAGGNRVPVLLLSTLAGIDDRVTGLDAGGDDYLVKPFALEELFARVHALARRSREDRITRRVLGPLEIDLIDRKVIWSGAEFDLLPREFELLDYLARHADQVVTKAMLLQHVWGFAFDPRTSVVETHMSRLRARLERSGIGDLIVTVRGGGYVLRTPV
jgi:two-component system, OmpR family, response regulator